MIITIIMLRYNCRNSNLTQIPKLLETKDQQIKTNNVPTLPLQSKFEDIVVKVERNLTGNNIDPTITKAAERF